ncbi:MAG: FMN-binding glutamate synthase family protein [Gammaproteobacteria bacterium]|nr:FMN-binding glutamate synthase family protein [Gammaproteobacteria bacterium]
MNSGNLLCMISALFLFLLALGLIGAALLLVLFLQDVRQTEHTIRRNYPVVGRLRYLLERLGEALRQYFFTLEREEQPFDRATRSWVYRMSKNLGGTIGFGSTYDVQKPGALLFCNAPYPVLEEEQIPAPSLVIGPDAAQPFTARSIFNIAGMSYGALSAPAVRALSRGARAAEVWLNTGEGGLAPYHLEGGCDLIFQIGTAKFGVHDADGRLDTRRLREVAQHVRAFELKLAQGAKPGRGGVLPGVKVTPEVAALRGIPVGQSCYSPNRHPEITDDDSLLDMIARIRDATGRPVGIKVVLGCDTAIRSLCETILRRGVIHAPDFITLDGGDGGTGAAPQVLMDHMGLPLDESLPMLVDALHEAGLRERIRVIASGKLVDTARVAWALSVGADFAVTGRGFMFALGCIQAMRCHLGTCPTGVTSHSPRLQKGLVVEEKAVRVANYARAVNGGIDELAHACGLIHARQFRRDNVRVVQSPGRSVPLDELYPYPRAGAPAGG